MAKPGKILLCCCLLLAAAAAYSQAPQAITQAEVQRLTEEAMKAGNYTSPEQDKGQNWDARLKVISGTVSVKTADREDWVKVTEEIPLNSSDLITTDSDGTAELYLEDKAAFFIGRNTEMEVSSMAQSDMTLLLKFGSLAAKVQHILKDKVKMQVRTPTVVCAIRGTEFAVEYSRLGKNTGVAVFEEGRLAVAPLDDSGTPGPDQILENNMEISIVPGQKRFRTVPLARMLRHRGQVMGLRATVQQRGKIWKRLSPSARSELRDRALKRRVILRQRSSAKERMSDKGRLLKSGSSRKARSGRQINSRRKQKK